MNFNIENLGAVKRGEICLKPLTAFIGPNNNGKTWTAYALASLFTSRSYKTFLDSYLEKQPNNYDCIEDAVQDVLNKGNTKINIDDLFREYSTKYINDLCKLIPVNLPYTLGTSNTNFDNLNISIEITENFKNSLDITKTWEIEKRLSVDKEGNALLTASKEIDDYYLYIMTESTGKIQDIPISIVRKFIASEIFKLIHRSFFPNVYFLPSERTGIIQSISSMSTRVDDDKKESELKDDADKKEKTTYLSLPVGSLLDMLASSAYESLSEREEKAGKNKNVKKYLEMADLLEKDIIGGTVETVKKSDGTLEFIYSLNGKDAFNLKVTSSCVKDLTPLIYYLRFLAKKGDIIVIDEPEMNLHPESQIKVMELLAMMVNWGINVVITTHSTYLVDHLSNLTKAYTLKEKEGLENKFKLGSKDSFISQNNISVYLFENGTIKDVYGEDGLIDWGTFSKESDYVAELYFDL